MAAPIMLHSAKIEKLDLSQILRYSGMGGGAVPDSVMALVDKLTPSMLDDMSFKACYLEAPVTISGNYIDFEYTSVESKNLSVLLDGCDKVILVAATAGIKADMIVKRAEVTSKAEALILNSIAIAGIEKYMAVLNSFFKEQYPEYELRPRFSPGYGDVPLEFQKELLNVLDSNRKIGVTLSNTLLMTPTKSVTAIIGLGKSGCVHIDKDCDLCSKKDCEFRL